MKIFPFIFLIILITFNLKAETKKYDWQQWFAAKELFNNESYKVLNDLYLKVPTWFDDIIRAESARDTLSLFINELAYYQQDYLLGRRECLEDEYDADDVAWPLSFENCSVLKDGILLKKYSKLSFLANSGLLKSNSFIAEANIYANSLMDFKYGLINYDELTRRYNKYWNNITRTQKIYLQNEIYDFETHYYNWFNELSITENRKFNDIIKDNEEQPAVEVAKSGTGFYINNEGHIVTNNHVIEGCNNIFSNNMQLDLIVNDPINDLAVLKSKNNNNNFIYLETSSPKKGEEVLVIGYPFGKDLSSESKITQGIVSSLEGMGNDFTRLQIDAAIQPGNSGGPVLNKKGNVIGVAVATANIKSFLEAYGTIPQNMNFAIKGSVLKMLLDAKDIKANIKKDSKKITNEEIYENANKAVIFIYCK